MYFPKFKQYIELRLQLLSLSMIIWLSWSMQFQVKLIIFTYLKTEDSLASKVHFCGLDLQTTSLCVGGPWVWIPSGAQIFNVPSYGWFFTSPFISFIIYYTPWHWLVGWLEAPSWVRHFLLLTWLRDACDGLCDAAHKSNPQKWPLLANESSVAQRLKHPILTNCFLHYVK